MAFIYKTLSWRYIYDVVVIVLSCTVTSRACRLMCWVNGGNEQSFFTAAGDSFRVTSVLYLRACVREQLFEAKATGIPPLFHARQKFLVKGAPNNFEGKSGFGGRRRRGGARGSSSFVHIFLALRLVNRLLRVAPSVYCPRPLFSFAFLSVFVLPFAHQRSQLSRGIAPICAHFNCARHRAISR